MAERGEVTGRLAPGPIVTVAWLHAHLDEPGIRVVDARPGDAYGLGHIPGAINADMYAVTLATSDPAAIDRFQTAAQAQLRQAGIRAGERVIFYEEISGTAAARGVWLLDYLGHGGGSMLDGGLHAWGASGGRITTQPVAVEPSDLAIDPHPDLLATADAIRTTLSDDKSVLTLIDTRSDLEHWSGTIPGAVHLEWVNHLNPDGTFRPAAELRRLYDRAVPDSSREIVTYCASGYRAAHTYVVLRALGFPRVRNYAPSWHEWSQRSDLPTELPGRAASPPTG